MPAPETLSAPTTKPGTLKDPARGETIVPNILIVDDRKENLRATEKVLKNINATIFTANSGNEALSLMLRRKFAVVLLDVQMPGMDGFETASLMQEEDSMRGTPIIFVTAISKEDQYASRAAEIGAVDYIFKPINADILRSKVNVYLDLYIQREQILKLNAILRESNEDLERFAYVCSHDLKSPLRAIDNLSQWIEEDLADALRGETKRHMDDLQKRVRRMEKLLDDMLEYARIGRKAQTGESETIAGKTLVEDVIGLVAAPREFSIQANEGFERINVKRMPLQQVLCNLVQNAVKHHDKDAGTIVMDVEDSGSTYIFSISDDGPGIDPRYHQKIFEMFQTLKSRDQKEGSGMGLAIINRIIAERGGNITVESEEGKGATFRFAWPK